MMTSSSEPITSRATIWIGQDDWREHAGTRGQQEQHIDPEGD